MDRLGATLPTAHVRPPRQDHHQYKHLILIAVEHGLSNARSEATNTHLRLLTRRAYGYHSPEALIAMAGLTRGGLCHHSPDDHEIRPQERQ
jgi:hypothetical protein